MYIDLQRNGRNLILIFVANGKVPPGCLLAEPVPYVTRFSMPLEPGFGIMPLSSALSQFHILCVARLLPTPSEMCPLKLTDFCLFLYNRSYTMLQGPLIPPMVFTSCHDWGLNRLPPDGRAITLSCCLKQSKKSSKQQQEPQKQQ